LRRIFKARFATDVLETGDPLESIAYGLALIAASGVTEARAATY
jgi:hypothetical protein